MSSWTRLKLCPSSSAAAPGQRLVIVARERLVRQHAEQRPDPLAARCAAAVDAEVVGEHLVQRPRVPLSLVEHARHLGLDVAENLTKLGPDVHARRVPDLLDEPCHGAGTADGLLRMDIMIRECSTFCSPSR